MTFSDSHTVDRVIAEVERGRTIVADTRPEHSPRVNVVGARRGGAGPVVHLNGHIDVVPVGEGWTVDPFGAAVGDGKIFGRGA